MITRRFSIVSIALVAAFAAMGCQREELAHGEQLPNGPAYQPGHAPDPRGGPDATMVRQRLISERCAFEQRCNQVGEGRPFADANTCTSTVAGQWASELDQCGALESDVLDQCLNAMRQRSCREPIGRLDSVNACNVKELCQSSSR